MSLFGPSVVRVLEAYAGCRQKACTVPEELVGMGKSEWGLGMLHKRLGLCSFFSHIYTMQKKGQQSPQVTPLCHLRASFLLVHIIMSANVSLRNMCLVRKGIS